MDGCGSPADTTEATGCNVCVQSGLVCDLGHPCVQCLRAGAGAVCSLRRKRGRPRKVKPDPNAPKPHVDAPKHQPVLLPASGVLRRAEQRLPPVPSSDRYAFAVPYHAPTSSFSPEAPEFAEPPQREPHHHHHHKRRRTASHNVDRDQRHADADWRDDEAKTHEKRTPTMVPSVLKLLIDELQDMQRSVKSMKKDVSKLSSKQVSFSDMQHDLTQTLDCIPFTPTHDSENSTPLSSHEYSLPDTVEDSLTTAPTHAIDICTHTSEATRAWRRQLLLRFPFLSRYNIDTRDVPFAIDDLSKPIVIGRIMPDPLGKLLPMPHIVYANQEFCDVIKFQLNELQGCPASKIGVPTEAQKARMTEHLNSRVASDVGQVLVMEMMVRTKEGQFLKALSRHQILFDRDGIPEWCVVCFNSLTPTPAPPPVSKTIWEMTAATAAAFFFPSYMQTPHGFTPRT